MSPAVEPAADVASITLGDIQSDPQLSMFIASADRVMDAMGYTEHGFRHAHLVGQDRLPGAAAARVQPARGRARSRSPATCTTWATRSRATATGRAARCSRTRCSRAADGVDLMSIMAAIANHEEAEGTRCHPYRRRDPGRQGGRPPQPRPAARPMSTCHGDIHDRVNYAVEQSFLRVDSDARTVSSELTIDTKISQVMEYFEIFLGRMQMCRHAAMAIDATLPSVRQRQELA
jgi:hypothetical protein